MTIKLLHKHLSSEDGNVPAIVCADGFTMSVQAGRYHYAVRDSNGVVRECEVGYPSQREQLLMAYADDADNPTETVYPYVPFSVVARVIDAHGGIAGVKPLPRLSALVPAAYRDGL